MSQQADSGLQAELAALRQRLDDLEAEHRELLRCVARSGQTGLSRKFLLGALPVMLLLATGGLLYGQGAGDALFIHPNGNVGIGTTSPNEKLHVSEGNVQLDGDKQIKFTNTDTSNNLKLQLWTGYGLGINPGTLFYAANGRHSWRGNKGENERMYLETKADGGLSVLGTGTSTFAGEVRIGGKSLEIGDRAAATSESPNGRIGFPGSGVRHGQIRWVPATGTGGRFELIDSSSGSPSGDYGASPGFVSVKAQNGTFEGDLKGKRLQIGSTFIEERELQILKKLAAGELVVDLFNTTQGEYLYAADFAPYDKDRRRVFTWRRKTRVNQGYWRLEYPR